jgi:hypothetical protein
VPEKDWFGGSVPGNGVVGEVNNQLDILVVPATDCSSIYLLKQVLY